MDVSVFLGTHNNEGVYWVPKKEKNPHFLVVGTSGSGKTESLKAIIHELKSQGIPSLIIDFHNEYRDIAENHINLRDLTINPLEVIPGKRPQDVVYEVANIIKKVFRLGDRQEALLRSAIKDCYVSRDIDILKAADKTEAPGFLEVRERILEMTTPANKAIAEGLLNRIDALFEVDIFFEENTVIPFEKIAAATTTIELKDFPTEDVKAAIAEFFLNKLVYYLYQQGKTKELRLYCVVDEAHRLLYEHSPLDRMLREARKYGTGVILSSQRPTDFSETILANTGGLLSLQCNLEKDAKFIAKQMGLDYRDILLLSESGLAFLKMTSSPATAKVRIIPMAERLKASQPPGKAGESRKSGQEPVPEKPGPGPPKEQEAEQKPGIFGKLREDPRVKELHKEMGKLRHQLDKRDLEVRAYLARIASLKEENTRLEKELKMVVGKRQPPRVAVSGKLCRGCSFMNDRDALYCTECGKRL